MRAGRVVWDGTAERLVAEAPGSAHALVTSDDDRALALAASVPGVRVERSARGELAVSARDAPLDQYVLALGAVGVAVRRLELLVSPLERMFFALTSGAPSLDDLGPHELTEAVLAGV
jgi:hypothetical protein